MLFVRHLSPGNDLLFDRDCSPWKRRTLECLGATLGDPVFLDEQGIDDHDLFLIDR